jgi:hypothetical protein
MPTVAKQVSNMIICSPFYQLEISFAQPRHDVDTLPQEATIDLLSQLTPNNQARCSRELH